MLYIYILIFYFNKILNTKSTKADKLSTFAVKKINLFRLKTAGASGRFSQPRQPRAELFRDQSRWLRKQGGDI